MQTRGFQPCLDIEPDWIPGPHPRFNDPQLECIQWSRALSDDQVRYINGVVATRPDLKVRIYGYKREYDWSQLSLLRDVRRFGIDCTYLTSFEHLEQLHPALEELTLGSTQSKRPSLAILDHFESLKRLWVFGHKKKIESIQRHTELKTLYLRSITLDDLDLLRPLRKLDWLWIGLGGTRSLHPLNELPALKYLKLVMILGFADLSPLADSPKLEKLKLESLPRVTDLTPLTRMPSLQELELAHMRGVNSLEPLRKAQHLHRLRVIDCGHLTPEHFAPLKGHPALQSVRAGLGSIKKNTAVSDLLNLPSD